MFRFIDLFAGIGGMRIPFEEAGGRCVFSCEIDPSAAKTYEVNFGEAPTGDIRETDSRDIPDFEILLAGFPCQSFSVIGKKEGFADQTRGTLFFEIERILREKRPRAFLLENVRNLTGHDGGRTFRTILEHLEALGYHVFWKVLNTLDYGLPQHRLRVYIAGFLEEADFSFPKPQGEPLPLSEILESAPDRKYYVREEIRRSRLERLKDKNYPRPYISHENIGRSVTPHPYAGTLRAGASANYLLVNDERRLTEREMLRLQGFPEDFKIVVPATRIRAQCGNAVSVPVVRAIAGKMLEALGYAKKRP